MVIPRKVPIETIIANSFRNYHVKGFDYICLKRSERETIKLYFFDGDVSKLPEVINPHDHRYDFDTTVLAGSSENIWFGYGYRHGESYYGDKSQVFQRFKYLTPLNGGNGFSHDGEVRLVETARGRFYGSSIRNTYSMQAHELHTIRMVENETILMLRQFEDVVPIDKPTLAFTRDKEPPSLSGLYERFTADQVIAHLDRLKDRTGLQICAIE